MQTKQVKPVLVRLTTIPLSLDKLLTGQLKFMSQSGFDVHMVSSHAANVQQLAQRENSTFHKVTMTRTIAPVSDLVSLFKLVKLFRQLNPAIVHSHTPKAGLLGMLAAKISGVPVRLHTVAGLPLMEATGVKRKILNVVERLTYWCATAVYPNSSNLQTFILQNKFCKAEKLKVIGNGSSNGINTSFFAPTQEIVKQAAAIRKKYTITPDQFVFIFIGRVVQDKGIVELVEAFTKLKNIHLTTRLQLVGPFEPDLDPLPAHIVATIKSDPHIVHTGYQDDVRPYLAASNAMVFPSYREGFPNVPMQAGCFDLPVIVTNINGCNEIIEHGKNGVIIDTKSVDQLQNSMELFMTDKSLYDSCKQHARQMIVSRYDQPYVWHLILNEYNHKLDIKTARHRHTQ